jgi:isopentenyl diphosphate isomerase/L-lactate dehydrogenase-like FMN-dependent dehydrogenase
MTRRQAVRRFALFAAGSHLLRAQEIVYHPERLPLLTDLVNVLEFEPVARARISKQNYDYIAGGVDDEWTLRRNREAFQWFTLRPRMLVDVSKLDLSLDLFGQRIDMPILVAPTGGMQLAHPDGELAMARAAGQMKTIQCVSSNSSYPLEKIVEAATGPVWFQLYSEPDLDTTRERVERAAALGCKTICWTVDAPYNSHRERNLRNRLTASSPAAVGRRRAAQGPNPYRLERRFTSELTWQFVGQIQEWSKLPVLLKGILTPEDAERAVKNGAAGVIVSNHGGRYLGSAPSTIEVLASVVDAVGAKIPVLVDGGFRRGTDILKGLALGAKAVMVGRATLWGLAAYGQPGAVRALEMLQSELALAMALSGRPNLASIDRSLVSLDRK